MHSSIKDSTCICSAYPFPHRWGSGKCPSPWEICEECHEPAEGILIDEGIGAYECHGARGVHHAYARVSECCHAPVISAI